MPDCSEHNPAAPETLAAQGVAKSFRARSSPPRASSSDNRPADLIVLRDVNVELARGQSMAVIGPSGSGKSTLLNILGTLEPPSAGRVSIGGVDPFSLSPAELARLRNRRIGFVFQEHHLLPQCSALENVLIPTLPDRPDATTVDRARRLLDRVGLRDRVDHLPAEMSGGERQRVAVARALINRPTVLLADEPTGNLDRRSAAAVADLLLELHREQNTILVVVTHSQALAERFARTYELVDGMLVPVES